MKNIPVVLFGLALALGMSCARKEGKEPQAVDALSPLYNVNLKPFYHGVASGDPLQDRVVIWSRVTPEGRPDSMKVTWEVAEDNGFEKIVQQGVFTTSPLRDYTIKVDVAGLQPGRHYYYRFISGKDVSPVGRTKTAPVKADSVKLAVVSCANWEWGYFNTYGRIAEKEVDAMVHLGDYLYEYKTGRYGDTTIGRINAPLHEIVTLDDYRTRHAQYRLDGDLQQVTGRHPLIAVWDDHEVANNVYSAGAENHQADKEGDFMARKKAARQAYYEWLPLRDQEQHYRNISYGNLVDLIMLDERLVGRTKPADSLKASVYLSESQSMLGTDQLQWFLEKLNNRASVWKVIGNQVLFSELDRSSQSKREPRNLDSWDGYPAERNKITDYIQQNHVENIIFLAGDTHASWAFDVIPGVIGQKGKASLKKPIAIELGTTSVNSGNWDEGQPVDTVVKREQRLLQDNPHLKYLNGRDHGYVLLELYPDQAIASWYFVETVRRPSTVERKDKMFRVNKGKTGLVE